ncbi:MAG: hypothetical protein KAY37_08260 [Phycisphaerae bacterium]|nr:hypothetical protein [Phycisphaerae bacterium]
MPAVILVPTSLSAMGTMLFKSLEIRDTTADSPVGNRCHTCSIANPHAGKFRGGVGILLPLPV